MSGAIAAGAGGEPELLVLNPNTNAVVTELIAQRVRRALAPGSRVRTRAVDWGAPSVETRIDAAVATLAVLDALTHERQVHGVLVAAFGDPGLLAARELMDVPVVGIGESSLLRARGMGRFAILTIQPASIPLVEELVQRNGCENECAGIHAVPVSVIDASDPGAVRDHLAESAIEWMRGLRADAVILGGAPLGVHADHLSDLLGVPCIDPIETGVQRLSDLVTTQPSGHRAPAYTGLQRKLFEGDIDVLDNLNSALWRV
jgi:allantoin racemase